MAPLCHDDASTRRPVLMSKIQGDGQAESRQALRRIYFEGWEAQNGKNAQKLYVIGIGRFPPAGKNAVNWRKIVAPRH
jgi:hypothetical protein